jgi:hypothetical protein
MNLILWLQMYLFIYLFIYMLIYLFILLFEQWDSWLGLEANLSILLRVQVCYLLDQSAKHNILIRTFLFCGLPTTTRQ